MKGKRIFSKTVADEIVNLIGQKLRADNSGQKLIRDKIRKLGFYASDFGLGGGYTTQDFLRVANITGGVVTDKVIQASPSRNATRLTPKNTNKRHNSDEAYVISLCDKVLKQVSLRQHKFDFLLGDPNHNGTCAKLPVDAYYPSLKLVIEYRERQHTEAVKFFDRRETVSGMGRGEQRRLYDERRRKLLPENGLTLIEISFSDFEHDSRKRIIRNENKDAEILKSKLQKKL